MVLQLSEQIYIAGFTPPFPGSIKNSNSLYVSSGIISGIDEFVDNGYKLRYTNAPVEGLSGGPIVNTTGELVGINGISSMSPNLGTSSSFGIPINEYLKWKNKKLSIK